MLYYRTESEGVNPVEHCESCGAEFYPYEEVYVTHHGECLCLDRKCLSDYFGIYTVQLSNNE